MPSAQLDAYARSYRDAQQRLHTLADGLTDEQFNWKPAEGRWSIAEIVHHLNKMSSGYLFVLEERLSHPDIKPLGDRELRHGWIGGKFVKAMSPGGRPLKTMPRMAPPQAPGGQSDLRKASLMDDFDGYTDRFAALIEGAEGKAIDKVRISSPFLKVMRLPIATFLDALGQHALRHAGQAEKVAQSGGFPLTPGLVSD